MHSSNALREDVRCVPTLPLGAPQVGPCLVTTAHLPQQSRVGPTPAFQAGVLDRATTTGLSKTLAEQHTATGIGLPVNPAVLTQIPLVQNAVPMTYPGPSRIKIPKG